MQITNILAGHIKAIKYYNQNTFWFQASIQFQVSSYKAILIVCQHCTSVWPI